MTLLTPLTALLAAAIAVPVLVALYLLKLRRRFLRVPTTLLWQRTTEDLQVNVPFQRLRLSVLFVIQLLVLLCLVLAMAQPRLDAGAAPSNRLILLIDRSASMGATDGDREGRTRLDVARAAAADMVESLGGGSGAGAAIIAFATSATLVCGFESDRDSLLEQIGTIEPGHGGAALDEALRVAEALARQTDESDETLAEIVLLSDGGVDEPQRPGGFTLQAGNFRYVRTGPEPQASAGNVGIVSFSARREYEDPARVLVFARMTNCGPQPVDLVLTLRRDGEVAGLHRLTVPPADDRGPGEAPASFALELAGGAVLTVSHGGNDALRADDSATLILPPPSRPRVALVHGAEAPDVFLHEALGLMDLGHLEVMPAERYAALDPQLIDSRERFDLIVFDRVSGAPLPALPSLTFGGVPAGIEATGGEGDGGRRFLTWERQHPLLRHVGLDDVIYAGFGGYRLPDGATALASGGEGPLIVETVARGARHVLVGFEPGRSTWPVQVSFAVFLTNALDYLTLPLTGHAALSRRPGEAVTVRVRPDVDELRITGPIEAAIPLSVAGPGALRTLPPFERVGLYTIDGALPPDDRIAVNMLSESESDIRTRASLLVNARPMAAGSAADAAPRELWPWLLAAAGVLLFVEWLVYCRLASG